MKADYDEVEFETSEQWRAWLDARHADTDGIWLRMYKKVTGIKTVTYAEALDEALCYGWIDGQMKKKMNFHTFKSSLRDAKTVCGRSEILSILLDLRPKVG